MRSVHSDRMGCGIEPRRKNFAEAETLGTVEGNMCGIAMRDAVAPPGSKATSRPKGARRNLRVRRLRNSGQRDKLKADRSKGARDVGIKRKQHSAEFKACPGESRGRGWRWRRFRGKRP